MNKKQIETKLNQIISAANSIVSVGAHATTANAPQIQGICRSAREVWQLINTPDKKEEVKEDG